MSATVLSKGIEAALGGKYAEAIDLIVPLDAEREADYNHVCALSIFKIALGKYGESLLDCDRAERLAYGSTFHKACEVLALCGLGKLELAKNKLSKWRQSAPDDPLARGDILASLGEKPGDKYSNLDWDSIVENGLSGDLAKHIGGLLRSLQIQEEDCSNYDTPNSQARIHKGDRTESDKIKLEGNKLYKSHEFDKALQAYAKALEADPSNLSVYNNIGAVYMETGKFDECISECQKVIDLKSQVDSVDYAIISRAYERIASANLAKKEFDEAIKYYNRSLAEKKSPEVASKLREAKLAQERHIKELYRDPEISEKKREEGNLLFKKGSYSEAVAAYTEAIKRNDTDPRCYSNRAACYLKLMAWYEAEKDCEAALAIDPNFVRALIRKAQVLIARKEHVKALDILYNIADKDTEGQYTKEVAPLIGTAQREINNTQNSGDTQSILEKARQDPEIQKILMDPVMQTVLKQISEDPQSAKVHMSNPEIAQKILTLVNSGIVQVSRQ